MPPDGVAVTVTVYAPVVVPGFDVLPLLLPPHPIATAAIVITTSAIGTNDQRRCLGTDSRKKKQISEVIAAASGQLPTWAGDLTAGLSRLRRSILPSWSPFRSLTLRLG